jgi:eukaryotic-like serine/threonine-protein kinase
MSGPALNGPDTLATLLARDAPLPPRLRPFAAVCLAVARCHARGEVGLRLDPERVALGGLGEVELTRGAGGDRTAYAAPEEAHDTAAGPADVYALAAMLFELLAGQPLRARTADGVAAIPGEPRPSRRAPTRDIPPELDELCVCALAVDPGERPTARQLVDSIHGYLDGDRDRAARETLAREALARAQRAFISPDPAVFATALREAGRAVALDPSLPGAAELVTRIMLEPPRVMPAELADTIAADRLATVRRMSRAVTYAYIAYLVFSPAFLWLGTGHAGDALALTAIVAVNALLLARQGFTSARPLAPVVAIGNCTLIAVTAHLWSPFLAAPGVAAIMTMVSAMSPMYRKRRWVALMAAGMTLAIVGTLALELLGALSPTTLSTPGGFELVAAGLNLRPTGKYLSSVLFVCALLAAAAGLGYAIRGGERSLRERLLYVAWQLRQLVPTGS